MFNKNYFFLINIKFYDRLNWFIKINFEGISQKKKREIAEIKV